jgi:RNA polymerase subunit RPABC4/transcription elongation factor Spt4
LRFLKMFFLIGGIQPRTRILDRQPRSCPACGHQQVLLKRVDSYFSLFFIPLIRVRKGIPFLACGNCGTVTDESGVRFDVSPRGMEMKCRHCGGAVAGDFIYCPYCGKSLE